MTNTTIADYYKYAIFSTAAYVRMAGNSLDGASFAREAASAGQTRLPISLGNYLFDPNTPAIDPKWNIRRYFRNDLPAAIDPIVTSSAVGETAAYLIPR